MIVKMERVLLKEHNYLEWEDYFRDELLGHAVCET
jgi:hypothetical protein